MGNVAAEKAVRNPQAFCGWRSNRHKINMPEKKAMGFRLLVAMVLLCSAFAGFASAGYTERLTVQVFDQAYRPVEGAQAYVDYQLNAVSGYMKTKPKLTSVNGTADLLFTNYEQIDSSTLTSYTLYVKYGDQVKTMDLIARGEPGGLPPRRVDVLVESYYLFLTVRDQKGAALQAVAMVGGQEKAMDGAGAAIFQLPPGTYVIKTEIGGTAASKEIALSEDKAVDIVMPLYLLDVIVEDEQRQPLQAQVSVDGKEKETDARGRAVFENISMQNVDVTVVKGTAIKHVGVDLERQKTLEIVFDVTKPVVKDLHAEVSEGGEGTITLFVEDAGPKASGVDVVSISYETGGIEEIARAYTVSYNTFVAKIPSYPPGTTVKYSVKVKDRDGNIGLGVGVYTVPAAESGDANGTQQGKPSQPGAKTPSALNVEMIALYICIFAVFSYGVFYYYRNRKVISPPTQEPPQVRPPEIPPKA